MRAYISVADAAERTRRRGQGAKGSGCGSGWDGASSGQTELHVDATGGAQDGVGCHGRDILGPYPHHISGYLPQHSYHVYWAIAHCIFQAMSRLYRGGCKGNLGGVPFLGLLCNYRQTI